MSKIWMPSNPRAGAGTGVQSVGGPFWPIGLHWSFCCCASTEGRTPMSPCGLTHGKRREAFLRLLLVRGVGARTGTPRDGEPAAYGTLGCSAKLVPGTQHAFLRHRPELPACGRRHEAGVPQNVCSCGSPLLVDYDLEAVGAGVTKETVAARPPDMWRYRELLPLDPAAEVVSLGEGATPLLRPTALGSRIGLPGLLVKDEGLNPTGTFKARGASCGISMARALGIREVALPSAGNAGAAWACYGAAGGINVHVAMPRDTPLPNQLECRLYGAELTLVDGLISDAGKIIAEGIAEHGWFDASTLRSRTGSRARRLWGSRSPSSSAGRARTRSSIRPAAASASSGSGARSSNSHPSAGSRSRFRA